MNLMNFDEQFIVHILNNLMSEYDHQVMETFEKKIGSATDPLTIEELTIQQTQKSIDFPTSGN